MFLDPLQLESQVVSATSSGASRPEAADAKKSDHGEQQNLGGFKIH